MSVLKVSSTPNYRFLFLLLFIFLFSFSFFWSFSSSSFSNNASFFFLPWVSDRLTFPYWGIKSLVITYYRLGDIDPTRGEEKLRDLSTGSAENCENM